MAPVDLPLDLRNIVDYRKSGLSLNHIVGCPLDCGYCVRHLFSNFDMKRPHLVMDDYSAVNTLVAHWAFQEGLTPIQLFNRATDPFLPSVKEHLFLTLEELDRRELTNPVLVITRWHVESEDVVRLERLNNIKLTILVTWSGIDDKRLEPVDSKIAEESLKVLGSAARRTKKIFYWRPLISGVNDTEEHMEKAKELSKYADATVFTGLFYRNEMRDYFRNMGLQDLYEEIARRKVLPYDTEKRVLKAFNGRALFRKTSCGVSFAHGVSDYNGHYCIQELCDICPPQQVLICKKAHQKPSMDEIYKVMNLAQLNTNEIFIDERRIELVGTTEQQRYFVQHALNYQVHDKKHPHIVKRHGRAEIGWA